MDRVTLRVPQRQIDELVEQGVINREDDSSHLILKGRNLEPVVEAIEAVEGAVR